jgi:hypothetical protein
MSQRNTTILLASMLQLFLFTQGAYGWTLKPSSGGWGSDQVVGTCNNLNGTVDIPGDDGRSADVNLNGLCDFVIPAVTDIPCDIHLKYTLPVTPAFEPVSGGYQQDWTALCNDPGLMVEGLLTCDNGEDVAFKDALGLAGPNGNTINSSLCQKTFGSANATVFSAQITFESMDSSSRVVDISTATTWNCCHADVADSLSGSGGIATCKDMNDIQKCFGSGTNVTRAYCTYNEPFNSSCGGPNAGKITADLHADVPPEGAADPEAVSISLDTVALGSIQLNGYTPSQMCTRKTVNGEDVIECKFERCDSSGNFIAPGGVAVLSAMREDTATQIECVNQLSLIN